MNKTLLKLIGFALNLLSHLHQKKAVELAFFLFCLPKRHPIKAYHLSFFNSAIQNDLLIEDKKIRYYQWGNGPRKVLFLHGWNSSTFRWKKYIESLDRKKYTVLSVDATGCGQSEGNQLHAFVYSKIIRTLTDQYKGFDVVVSHSFGALSTMVTLHEFAPVKIKSIILMASPTEIDDFFRFFGGSLHLNKKIYAGMESLFIDKFGREPSYFSLSKFAQKISIPTLVIHDPKDRVAPYEGAKKMSENFVNAQLFTTDTLGHDLKSPLVIDRVNDFIERNSASS
ncbi:MAG: alpha/beta fold hydrolase [Leadbetterella sp.]